MRIVGGMLKHEPKRNAKRQGHHDCNHDDDDVVEREATRMQRSFDHLRSFSSRIILLITALYLPLEFSSVVLHTGPGGGFGILISVQMNWLWSFEDM